MLLEEGMLDKSASVRDVARFHLKKTEGFSARSFYLEKVKSMEGHALAMAIRGLGESGIATDSDVVRPLLNQGNNPQRKAVIYALGQLSPGAFTSDFMHILEHGNPSVAGEAYRQLARHHADVQQEQLINLLSEPQPERVRKLAFLLVRSMSSKWPTLSAVIKLCCGNSALALKARRHLMSWLDNPTCAYETPSAAQLLMAQQATQKMESELDSQLHHQLKGLFDVFRKR